MAKIVIIGGGVAGLSCGIYSRLNGFDVTVCESHSTAGGNLTGWDRGEYHIDNCIHWLTGSNPNTALYKSWLEIGALGQTEVINPESLYTCFHEGKELSLKKDLNALRQDMLYLSPQDQKETESFIKAVKVVQGLTGIGGKNHDKGYSWFQKITKAPTLLRYYNLSTKDLAQKFKHPLLKKFIIGFLGEDFASLALIFVTAHICGLNGGIPEGGSRQMAERITQRFLSLGGKLKTNARVVKANQIRSNIYSVTLDNGEEISCDYVVYTADPDGAFGSIFKAKMPKELQKAYDNPKMKRFSSYHCAFSCDQSNLPFNGDYIFEIPVWAQMILRTKNLIVREFSRQKSFAPDGKNILQTLSFCEEKDCENFIELYSDKKAYEQKKKEIADLVQSLIEQKFPDLVGKLQVIDVWTPATYKRFTASKIGSYMSFAMPPSTMPTAKPNRVKGIKNLILATQWQQIPGGLPIALNLGKKASQTIYNLNKKQVRIEKAPSGKLKLKTQ